VCQRTQRAPLGENNSIHARLFPIEELSSTWEPRDKKAMMKGEFAKIKLSQFASPQGIDLLTHQLTVILLDKYRDFQPRMLHAFGWRRRLERRHMVFSMMLVPKSPRMLPLKRPFTFG